MLLALPGCDAGPHGESSQSIIEETVPQPEYGSRFIIHASGTTPQGTIGSNSIEAINHSYQLGYRTIEIDFTWTSDGRLVCVHDWLNYYGPLLNKETLSYAEFEQLRTSYGYTSMTLDDLAQWLTAHKDVVIVTDIKENNISGAKLLAETYPELIDQFWVQIYKTDEYDPISQLGYKNIILTVYQMTFEEKSDTATLIQFAKSHPLSGITFPIELMDLVPGYFTAMQEANTPLYVHTINDLQTQSEMFDMGFSGVYTDVGDCANNSAQGT